MEVVSPTLHPAMTDPIVKSHTGRGGGRGGFVQRDFGPPDTVLGTQKISLKISQTQVKTSY